jgi:hypothetical protein
MFGLSTIKSMNRRAVIIMTTSRQAGETAKLKAIGARKIVKPAASFRRSHER